MKDNNTVEGQVLFDFFSLVIPLDDEIYDLLGPYIKKKSYKKGDSILKEGEIETKANVVVEGVVHQYIYEDDQPKTVNITPKGLSFNSLKSYLSKEPSLEIQEAITDVEVVYMMKEDIDWLAKTNSKFAYLMFKVYENILLDRENRMFLLQYKNPTKRLRLFHETVSRAHMMIKDTPDKYIASYLNMTPQQYSNEKRKLMKEGL
ncbi:Crp/Fnr family transcriptional regulator [Marivirga salinae]|uniref:Crp/Fnr family transcriptional regulator n=1 Tax=Marivirga salinarum TaxID=3059078 RepID=A0AA51NA59_9BACT|nr:Crp/Fnr family transcriptional regulator [Marivirga sp. BDSF4-3]WMN11502.1 Crp/Fnr family transcriptional regulator [Marivirga sp. BDSF4-3]